MLVHNVSEVSPKDHVATTKTVLCYGHYAVLLNTRKLLLKECVCALVVNDDQYRAHLRTTSPDLIVFCQSLTAKECKDASELASKLSPDSRLLFLFTGTPNYAPERQHVLLDASDGPQAFYQTAWGMLYGLISPSLS